MSKDKTGPAKLSLDQLEKVTGGFDPEDQKGYGNGNDHIVGSDDINWIDGRGGDDTIDGRGGNDQIVGGAGNDIIDGGSGNDMLHGSAGNDVLNGGAGNDTLLYRHGGGDDVIDGGDGHDTLSLILGDTNPQEWKVIVKDAPNMTLDQMAEREGGLAGLEATILAPDGGVVEFKNLEFLKLS